MKKFLTKDNLNRTTETTSYDPSDFTSIDIGVEAPVKTEAGGKLSNTLIPGDIQVDAAKEIAQTVILGESISALKLVYLGADGKAYMATSSGTYEQARVLGILLQPGVLNDEKRCLLFGRLDDPFFSFAGADDLYLGPTGNIVDSAPTSGHYKPVGQSLGTGSIFLKIGSTIIL
jgi:hypothetical protein